MSRVEHPVRIALTINGLFSPISKDLHTYRLCADTGCGQEDLPRDMDDRAGWRERSGNSISARLDNYHNQWSANLACEPFHHTR